MKKIIFQNLKINLRDGVDESVFNEIFKYEEYKLAVETIKKAQLPILDIGAHAGFFSLWAHTLNPEIKIYSLEPEKKNFEALRQHIKNNNLNQRVKVFEIALDTIGGAGILSVSPDSHNHCLARDKAMNESLKRQEIKTVSLSGFMQNQGVQKFSLVKMDIEGGEYEIFETLNSDDFARVESFIIEAHQRPDKAIYDLEKILKKNHFVVEIKPSRFAKNLCIFWAKQLGARQKPYVH